MNDEGEMGGGIFLNDEDAEPPAAPGQAGRGTSAVWIEAPWQPGAVGARAALLLYDAERRSIALTRGLRLPMHERKALPADATDLQALSAAMAAHIGLETGCIAHRLRSLHRIDVDSGTPGACLYVLAVACTWQDDCEMTDLTLLDIDEAVHMANAGAVEDGATVALLKFAQRNLLPQRALTIVVTGPCETESDSDPAVFAAQVAAMEACVLPLYEAGHLPVLGDWVAQPTARLAGTGRPGSAVYDRLLARCDGVLRVGGASKGTDQMVATARRLGKAVYDALDQVPGMRPRLVSDHPMLFA